MFQQLVYTSSAAAPFSQEDLAQIALSSRTHNASSEVTGAILYHDGNVMQVLEGPAEAVEDTFQRICSDPRHHSVVPIYQSTVPERTFADWAMGVLNPETIPLDDRDGVRSLFDVAESGAGRAQRLLRAFRAVARR